MSWTDVPPGTNKVINVWGWLYQFWLACDERWSWVMGANFGPGSHFTQGAGQHHATPGKARRLPVSTPPPPASGCYV